MGTCKFCGSISLHEESRPPHIGLYCSDCGRWQQWVKQPENIETGETASEAQQKYALALLRKWKLSNAPMTQRQAGAIISAFQGGNQGA
jgi:hypothetical protein